MKGIKGETFNFLIAGSKDAFAKVTKIIYENVYQSWPTAAVVLDLTKAFDTANHKKILINLKT